MEAGAADLLEGSASEESSSSLGSWSQSSGSLWLGIIIALVGLIAFGGFAKGKWY